MKRIIPSLRDITLHIWTPLLRIMLMAASNISIFVVKCFRYVLHLPTKSDHEFHTTLFIWSDLMLSSYHFQESFIIIPSPTEHYYALLHIWNPFLRIVSLNMRISFDLCVICHTMRPRYDTRGAYCCLLSSFSLFSCLSLFGDYLDYFELKSDRVNQIIRCTFINNLTFFWQTLSQ